eukprot:1134381-Pelagomonas_calceolata.AAC.1
MFQSSRKGRRGHADPKLLCKDMSTCGWRKWNYRAGLGTSSSISSHSWLVTKARDLARMCVSQGCPVQHFEISDVMKGEYS